MGRTFNEDIFNTLRLIIFIHSAIIFAFHTLSISLVVCYLRYFLNATLTCLPYLIALVSLAVALGIYKAPILSGICSPQKIFKGIRRTICNCHSHCRTRGKRKARRRQIQALFRKPCLSEFFNTACLPTTKVE